MLNKKKICIGIIIIIVLLSTLFFLQYQKNNQNYVMKINGELIFQDEIDLYMNFAKNQMEISANVKTKEEKEKFWSQTFEGVDTIDIVNQKAMYSLIKNKVTAQNGKKMKLKITIEEENSKIQEIKNLWQELNIEPVSDEAIVIFSRDLLMGNKVFKQLAENITLEEEDILSSYNIYNVTQIIFDKKNQSLAEETLDKIKSGEKFEKFLSYNMSKNKDEKSSFYNGEFMNNNYEKAITSLKAGQVSTLIYMDDGIYIVKLESIEKPTGEVLTEIKLKYSDDVLNKKMSDEYEKKVKEWIDKASIERKETEQT